MSTFKEASAKVNDHVMGCLATVQSTDSGVLNAITKHRKKLAYVGYGLMGLMLCLMFSVGMADVVMASDPGGQVFTRANTAMQGVLRQIRTISSIIAALFLTMAFLMKMLSKNQRTVDEANTWIKRIAIAWACINAVGFILTFIQEIIGPDVAIPTIS
ncbi:MAG: hypothetical protein FWC16_04745 [Defluviitaleaceae bacterium]|nr:hypothetical protein [Defluviitaleaceae bacterium]MCL2274215.1 hypothetical protein [Defluviitaleaceae bacterium]